MSWKDQWNRSRERGQEAGFTLIEVLAAIVILSIVSLVLTSYFTNALSYSKSNQNKTIMVNLARNALFYMEKQDFEAMGRYFNVDDTSPKAHPKIEAAQCNAVVCNYKTVFINGEVLPEVLNPFINNIEYEVNITYQADLHEEMLLDTRKKGMAPYLIPIKVEVTGPGGPNANTVSTVVEGYIADEKIR
ncbi:prepilin-type N-terminal cleavage/methylation domain-containing protein [Paenibacillus tritici]|uniref:type IV pilus modification PilV family protein n=1 Tax=Paenibacillus tritici TaxID=1873425 RepID=UPI001BA7DD55|nr:prepilin-type N-terminal cleavage/methylation domain-containing protein [Paenibacillus tritici]QUL54530.1 prepilin-type N-terminal cleavage/methylation domain-containing protein [Paenibacillus tritici]